MTAKVNSTGQIFQFALANKAATSQLHAGEIEDCPYILVSLRALLSEVTAALALGGKQVLIGA